jgi:hypothetical protein
MSVPFDRLYTFLRDVSNHDDILIYRWHPAGSRKLEDCAPLVPRPASMLERYTARYLVCHDQEPLKFSDWPQPQLLQPNVAEPYSCLMTVLRTDWTVWDRVMLCHSELNSAELKKFEQDGAIGVYWWSHAIIARDWFRYAQHDSGLMQPRTWSRPFLIYNRAWSGTREYRLKFMHELIVQDLIPYCNTAMNFYDPDHYSNHEFKNSDLQVSRQDFEQHIAANSSTSQASADYNTNDYANSAFEIVLETLFDDERIQLTEKTLRPIACGQPFLLLAPAGSLAVLKKYGFRTFDHVWDECYDDCQDPVQRLQAVVNIMQHIADLSSQQQMNLRQACQDAVDHNRQWFFSQEFHDMIVQEFKHNFDHAAQTLNQHCSAAHWKKFLAQGVHNTTQQDISAVLQWLNQRAS